MKYTAKKVDVCLAYTPVKSILTLRSAHLAHREAHSVLNLPPYHLLKKLRAGLGIAIKLTNQMSDQNVTLEERENDFVYTIENCPACWGRKGAAKPMCGMPTGYLQGCVSWLLEGKEFSLREEKCVAVGDEHCVYIIDKPTA